MRRAAPLLALVALGCRVAALDGAAYVGPSNKCDNGCPSNASCVDGACVASETTFPIVLEAVPPSSAAFAPGVTFTIATDDRKAGVRDLKLPDTVLVAGRLQAGAPVPLVLRLERVGAIPGLPAVAFESRSIAGATHTPPMTLPPGDYYAYVSPANESDLESVPPVQLRDEKTREPRVVTLTPGPLQILDVLYAASFRTVDITLTDDAGSPLERAEARDVFVVDDTTGKLSSTIGRMCIAPGKDLRSTVTLTLAPEIVGHRYTLRVRPAASPCSGATPRVQPTIDYDFQALDVEGRGNKVTLTIPKTVNVFARVEVVPHKGTQPIDRADVIFRSVKLDPDSKTGRAWIETRVTVAGGGGFYEFFPGTYRADVFPSEQVGTNARAFAACIDCTIPAQDDKSLPDERISVFRIDNLRRLQLEVAPRVSVRGRAAGFDGALFRIGMFEASSSTSTTGFTPGGSQLLTRPQSGLVQLFVDGTSSWNVRASLDLGFYDLIVRSPEASGYPWIVRPHVEVPRASTLDLGNMTASAPVVFTGTVLDPSGRAIPRATIRARALVAKEPGKPPRGAVLVGETKADNEGKYRLVLPSQFSIPPSPPPPT